MLGAVLPCASYGSTSLDLVKKRGSIERQLIRCFGFPEGNREEFELIYVLLRQHGARSSRDQFLHDYVCSRAVDIVEVSEEVQQTHEEPKL